MARADGLVISRYNTRMRGVDDPLDSYQSGATPVSATAEAKLDAGARSEERGRRRSRSHRGGKQHQQRKLRARQNRAAAGVKGGPRSRDRGTAAARGGEELRVGVI
jgi:hypothetical protein